MSKSIFILPSSKFIIDSFKLFAQVNGDASHRPHSHEFYEILYLTHGQLEHSFNKQEPVNIPSGSGVIIPPGVEHSFSANGPYLKRDILIDKTFFQQICAPISSLLNLIHSEYSVRVFTLNIEEINFLESTFTQMMKELDLPSKQSLGLSALFLIFNKFMQAPSTQIKDTLLNKIIEKLNHPLHIKNGISSICQELRYTPQYLCHYFKKNMGITMTQYINEIRLKYIAFYLVNTNMSLREIADSVGIESLSYLNKLFYNYFGLTPKKYQLKNRTAQKQ